MTKPERALVLIPWHIGDQFDITLNTARAARRLRIFLAEEPELTRKQFESALGIDCRDKVFRLIPEKEDPEFLTQVLKDLRVEDVGLISSGGIPCFIDPGSWLVARLRAEGKSISALAGASILSTMLSLSGIDWAVANNRGTFALYVGAGDAVFREAVSRGDEPVFVFVGLDRLKEALTEMSPLIGKRLVSAFFDLTKGACGKYPYADRVLTMDCRAWLAEIERLPWKQISDVALMLHPRETSL